MIQVNLFFFKPKGNHAAVSTPNCILEFPLIPMNARFLAQIDRFRIPFYERVHLSLVGEKGGRLLFDRKIEFNLMEETH